MDDLLEQGITAYKAGKQDEARKNFITVVKQSPDSEYAWGWLYNVCNTDQNRIHCLKQIVRINPKSEKANQFLNQLLTPSLTSNPSPTATTSSPTHLDLDILLSRIVHAAEISGTEALDTIPILTKSPSPVHTATNANQLALTREVAMNKETEDVETNVEPVLITSSKVATNKETEDIETLTNQFEREAANLEKNNQWEELILTCIEWLQYSNNNLEALKQLALAYSSVGNKGEVEKYCNIAFSVLPSNSPDRKPFERILQRVAIDKNISSYKATNIELGQTWVSDADIGEIEEQLSQKQKDFDFSALNEVCKNCWHEITHSRQYGIPSKGRIEILTTEKIKNLLNIQAVRFIQEGAIAPEVYVRFEFSGLKIGVLKINNDGNTDGFHEKYNVVKSIVNALALTYYRDLVVPFYVDVDTSHKKRGDSPKGSMINYGGNKSKSKKFPRHYFPQNNVYEFREWHLAQHRARHDVIGHIRWISPGYQAGWEKQEQAMRAGIELPIGYTWVIEHERGEQEGNYLVLDGTDLSRRTRFLPPMRAENELNRLLIPFQ